MDRAGATRVHSQGGEASCENPGCLLALLLLRFALLACLACLPAAPLALRDFSVLCFGKIHFCTALGTGGCRNPPVLRLVHVDSWTLTISIRAVGSLLAS